MTETLKAIFTAVKAAIKICGEHFQEQGKNCLIYLGGFLQTLIDYGMPTIQFLIAVGVLIKIYLDIEEKLKNRKKNQEEPAGEKHD